MFQSLFSAIKEKVFGIKPQTPVAEPAAPYKVEAQPPVMEPVPPIPPMTPAQPVVAEVAKAPAKAKKTRTTKTPDDKLKVEVNKSWTEDKTKPKNSRPKKENTSQKLKVVSGETKPKKKSTSKKK